MRALGDLCPQCGMPPVFGIRDGDGIGQWFCGNDDCPLLCWDPSMTRAEWEALPRHEIRLEG